MTEVDWMGSTDPQAMMRFIIPHHVNDRVGGQLPSSQFSVSDRKLRLFAVACCRAIWEQLTDPSSRDAVETAERYADGEATDEDMLEANEASSNVIDREWAPYWATNLESVVSALRMVTRSGYLDSDTDNWYPPPETQCHIIRDLFAPFRPVSLPKVYRAHLTMPTVEPVGCLWITPTVLELARAAYESGNPMDPEALAVLADCLEESGCTDLGILEHLWGEQSAGHRPLSKTHYRGCHVVDALLGKE